MLTTVIGAYPKPTYLKITDWFNASGGTDTEYPTKFYGWLSGFINKFKESIIKNDIHPNANYVSSN